MDEARRVTASLDIALSPRSREVTAIIPALETVMLAVLPY